MWLRQQPRAKTLTFHGNPYKKTVVARQTATRTTRLQTTAQQEQALRRLSLRNKNSSHCHLEIIHGSGAGSSKTADSRRRYGILADVRQCVSNTQRSWHSRSKIPERRTIRVLLHVELSIGSLNPATHNADHTSLSTTDIPRIHVDPRRRRCIQTTVSTDVQHTCSVFSTT